MHWGIPLIEMRKSKLLIGSAYAISCSRNLIFIGQDSYVIRETWVNIAGKILSVFKKDGIRVRRSGSAAESILGLQ